MFESFEAWELIIIWSFSALREPYRTILWVDQHGGNPGIVWEVGKGGM